MSDDYISIPEDKLKALKSKLCEELEAELSTTQRSEISASQLYHDDSDNRILDTNLDVILLAIGFVFFIASLFLPIYKYLNGYETIHWQYEFFLSSGITESLSIALLGNLFIFFSPLFFLSKKPALLGSLALIAWIFYVNSTIVHSSWGENAQIFSLFWMLANILVTFGCVIRTIKYSKSHLGTLLPLVLTIASIALLFPGISLPVISLEGTVYKEEILETSRSMILDAVVDKAKRDSTKIEQNAPTTNPEASRDQAAKMYDELLSMYGFSKNTTKDAVNVQKQEISILNIVKQLSKSGHGGFAFLLVFFCVLVPIIKSNLTIGYSFTQESYLQSAAKLISKWSFADVFAIALILLCLAINFFNFDKIVHVDANLGGGFYYFVAYCFISFALAQFDIKKWGTILEKYKSQEPIPSYLEFSDDLNQDRPMMKSKKVLLAVYGLLLAGVIFMAFQTWSLKRDNEIGKLCLALTDPNKIPFEKIDTDSAINACQQALAAEPDSASLHAFLGRAFYAEHNYVRALSLLKIGAEKGNPVAQTNLGRMYESGDGVPVNEAEALKWFRKAAEQNYPLAQNNLGGMYQLGKGVGQDPIEAAKWYRKAAEQGDAFGQNQLGSLYENGLGFEQSDSEAIKWYQMAADKGDALGQLNLGRMYEKSGDRKPESLKEAVKWYQLAADRENPRAQSALAILYYAGRGVKKDVTEALKLFQKSAEQGDSVGQLWLGEIFAKGKGLPKNPAEAVKWYRKAAQQGNSTAQFRLGLIYFNGDGVPKNEAEAAKWYLESAEQGYANAQNNLGEMYFSGKGVALDYNAAFNWFSKAAQQEFAVAQGWLGYLYTKGYGVEKNEAEAAEWYRNAGINGETKAQISLGWMYFDGAGGLRKDATDAVIWFRKAAEQGDAQGQFIMGIMTEKGLGTPRNTAEAIEWYRKAAENGHEEAKSALQRLQLYTE